MRPGPVVKNKNKAQKKRLVICERGFLYSKKKRTMIVEQTTGTKIINFNPPP